MQQIQSESQNLFVKAIITRIVMIARDIDKPVYVVYFMLSFPALKRKDKEHSIESFPRILRPHGCTCDRQYFGDRAYRTHLVQIPRVYRGSTRLQFVGHQVGVQVLARAVWCNDGIRTPLCARCRQSRALRGRDARDQERAMARPRFLCARAMFKKDERTIAWTETEEVGSQGAPASHSRPVITWPGVFLFMITPRSPSVSPPAR